MTMDTRRRPLELRNKYPATTTCVSPAYQVFRLPELLEIVLLFLSQKELLLSQRVSRNFRHTIQGSIRLQRALFFAPDWNLVGKTFDAYDLNNRPGRKPENNRLLLRAFPGCYPTVTLVIVNDNTGPPSHDDLVLGRRGPGEHWSWDVCISFPADRAPETKPAVLYPEASWRRMYLSQPPCTSLHLVRRWQRSLNPAIVREGGIKMGEFVDEATKSHIINTTNSPPPSPTDANVASAETSDVTPESVRRWHRSYISSDRDWHFEGNIECSGLSLCEDGSDQDA